MFRSQWVQGVGGVVEVVVLVQFGDVGVVCQGVGELVCGNVDQFGEFFGGVGGDDLVVFKFGCVVGVLVVVVCVWKEYQGQVVEYGFVEDCEGWQVWMIGLVGQVFLQGVYCVVCFVVEFGVEVFVV